MSKEADLGQSSILDSAYASARDAFVREIVSLTSKIQVKPQSKPNRAESKKDVKPEHKALIKDFEKNRGRDLFYPMFSSGMGRGPLVQLTSDEVKYDMIAGIGVHFFGYAHPEIIKATADVVMQTTMQGNLEPSLLTHELLAHLLKIAGKNTQLKHGWITTCGSMANEIALKIIRQKKFPATKIFAFEDGFAGRTTALQEITDNPQYREMQPTYGEVVYLPFFDHSISEQDNVQKVLKVMDQNLKRYPGKFAALTLELAQGEGGFRTAPPTYFKSVLEAAHKRDLAVWVDEIQTFGRTGEFFLFQKYGLSEWIDVVTCAKLLQTAAVLYTGEFNPKPGLIAGTFVSSTSSLKVGKRILEMLEDGGFMGPTGKIATLSKHFENQLNEIKSRIGDEKISGIRSIGGMIGFKPLSGSLEDTKDVLKSLFENDVIAFYCGHGPYYIRMLPPLGCMTEDDINQVCIRIERVLTDL